MGRRFAYLLMLLCLPVLPVLAADALVESRLSFRRFTTIDGLPQMQTAPASMSPLRRACLWPKKIRSAA